MKFDKLHSMLPLVVGGKNKLLTYQPYNAVTLRFPGRHSNETDPIGGDFVVCVDDEGMGWVAHQFTHTDIFLDIEVKAAYSGGILTRFMEHYRDVVAEGLDPEPIDTAPFEGLPGIHPKTFLYAVQCLSIAEHRRFHKFEDRFGGRFLPLRFGLGIAEGLWTAADAAAVQRRGRPGVEMLERKNGTPKLTKELMQ